MKKSNIIRLTESDLHNIISRCVSQYINECDCGGSMGGGATSCGGLMVGNSDESGGVTYPFGKVQHKTIYNPKGKNKSKTNQVDMSDAMKRHNGKGGSISINNK